MFAIVLWHIDEHVIEFLERVVVSIAAEYVRHRFNLLLLISFIGFDIHTFQTRSIHIRICKHVE